MQEKLDGVSLKEVLDIYNEICSMIKSLEDKEKELMESDNNDKWYQEDDWWW